MSAFRPLRTSAARPLIPPLSDRSMKAVPLPRCFAGRGSDLSMVENRTPSRFGDLAIIVQ
jgi:hypothetical protein